MKQYFLIFAITFFSLVLHGQDVNETVPMKFGVQEPASGVDLSSGVLNINVPIDNSVIPLSLSYSAGGIKVNQIPGPYGLGWNLTAEAYIIREVRGQPDDTEFGYSGENQVGSSVDASLSYNDAKKMFYDGAWDTEPDIFRYSFLGYSGAFYINYGRSVVKLIHDNLKITPSYSDASGYYSFTITDPSGNIYYFSQTETLTNQVDNNPSYSYKYKWYLNSVNFYNSTRYLNFYYTNPGTITTESISQTGKRDAGSSDALDVTTKTIKNSYNPKIITKIAAGDKSIVFEYESRSDITNARRLSQIYVKEKGITYNQYELNYEYFSEIGTTRLKLKSIYKIDPQATTEKKLISHFSYYGENTGEKLLPPYNNKTIDHWGYYNANSINTLFEDAGADRDPDLEYTKACVLMRVSFPTGRMEEYQYELNDYYDGSEKDAGGLRVGSIVTRNEEGETYTKSFDYTISGHSSGEIYDTPVYQQYKYIHNYLTYYEYDIFNIFSYRPLSDINGRHIIYEKVTVTNHDGSKIENYYKTFSDDLANFSYYPARYDIKVDVSNSNLSTTSLSSNNDNPYGPNDFFGTIAGAPEKVITYRSDNKKLSEETVYYDYVNSPLPTYGIAYYKHKDYYKTSNPNQGNYEEFYIGRYELRPYCFRPSYKLEKNYDANDQTKYTQIRTEFTYNTSNYLISETETYNVGESTNHTIYEVNYLIDNSTGVLNVNEHNLVGHVKSIKTYVDNKLLSRNEKYYDNDAQGDVVLDQERSFTPQGSMAAQTLFTYQDGVVVQSLDNIGDQYNSLIFDDDYLNVIATVNNSSKDRAAYSSFELSESGNWNTPTLVTSEECSAALLDCQRECDGNSTCNSNCYIAYNTCQGTVNLSADSRTGLYAYDLSNSSISKGGLPLITYNISYWYKSGTVSLSGISSNTLLSSFTNNGWTFNERKIQLSSSTLTVSGSAIIDEVRLYPENASMATKTNTYWGPSTETDINNLSTYLEYDSYGRPKYIRDNNEDIVKAYQYNFGDYIITGADSYSAIGQGGNANINVVSNADWTITSNDAWISVSPTNGSGDRQITVACQSNPNSTSRSGSFTINSSGASKDVGIVQEPGPYISCLTSIFYNPSNKSKEFTINSNISWNIQNVRYVQGAGTNWLDIDEMNGVGDQTFDINVTGTPTDTWVAEFDVVGSGITKKVTVVYSAF